MDIQLQTAVIAAVVALTTAVIASMVTWRLERRKWLTGLKTSLQVEIHKSRMLSYPELFAIFGKLSTRADPPVDAAMAKELAREISDWIYSPGGMTAEAATRGAVFVVREQLRQWHKDGERPSGFYSWRNRALLLLRRDIDVSGLEDYTDGDIGPLLRQVQRDADAVSKRSRRWRFWLAT